MAPILTQNGLFGPFTTSNKLIDTTPTTVLVASRASLLARQVTTTVTVIADSSDGDTTNTLTGGAIAGIVIGSVVGILLLIWVIRSCFNLGAPPQERDRLYHHIEPTRHRHHSRHHSRPRSYPYTSEVSRPASVIVTDTGRAGSSQRQPTYASSDDRRGRRYKELINSLNIRR
ncbi:hypothetical protein E5D57_013012 [Metarhizium anisopliae]|nr:hypothetical protein E5D57_013012 [Metarhizium anisopliae]